MSIVASNVAGTYTDIWNQTYIDWSTGELFLDNHIKDVYTTSTVINSSNYNQKYAFIDSWKGPTEKKKTISTTTGVSRSTSVEASAEYKIF